VKNAHLVKLFVNPAAGGGKCRKLYPEIVQGLHEAGIRCDVIVSRYPGHITEVSSELAARGCETVIACGGDGTVNEVINGIAGTETALGIVPAGTANDFAVNMGISEDISVACRIIKQRRLKKIDLVRVNNDKFFAGTGCIGFDAEVAAFAARTRKKSLDPFLAHVLGGILKFFTYRPKTVELRFNEKRYFGKILLAAFGNTRSYARGILITPRAVPDDALLDICVVKPMPKQKILSTFSSAYKGAHINKKEITLYQTDAVWVQSVGPMELYGDGDFMTTTPFRLKVMPKSLNVMAGCSAF